MHEETGSRIRIKRLLWVVENFFQDEEKGPPWSIPTHELGFYYLFEFPQNSPLYEKETFQGTEGEHSLIFEWQPLATLEECVLFPVFLRKGLQDPPQTTKHLRIQEVDLGP
jgi:hypothetical protein